MSEIFERKNIYLLFDIKVFYMKEITFIKDYLSNMKDAQIIIGNFLEDEENNGIEYLNKKIDLSKFHKNKHEFKVFLRFISKISQNHNRSKHFLLKVSYIIKLLKKNMNQTFSNVEIFDIFESNKQILLILFDEKILYPDQYISSLITNGKYKNRLYPQYYYPEFKSFYTKQLLDDLNPKVPEFSNESFDEFNMKRKNGENDHHICQLIRNDSVAEFISYVNRANIPISEAKIVKSVFETNSFLLGKETSLIEYAAFFGSIQIFNYLMINNVELTSSLWLYAIHSNNPEIIHLLEEKHVLLPKNGYFEECLKEAIKCHHNDIVMYIQSNKMKTKNIIDYAFRYINYALFDDEMIDDIFDSYLSNFEFKTANIKYPSPENTTVLSFLFKYLDLYIVEFLVKNKKVDLTYKIEYNDFIIKFFYF